MVNKFLVFCSVSIILVASCSKKEDLPDSSAPAAQSQQTSTESHEKGSDSQNQSRSQVAEDVTLDHVLEVWNGGQRAQAVDLFLKIQWDQTNIFASDSVFSVSESEFLKLPQNSQLQLKQEAMDLAKTIRELSKYMVEQAKQNSQLTQKYRQSLLAFGDRISGKDQLKSVQMVGKAIVGYTEKELPLQ